MKRIVSLIVALLCVVVAPAFMKPVGARTPAPGGGGPSGGAGPRGLRVSRSGRSGHQGSGSGRQLFMRACARCHGADGKGKNGPQLAGKSLSLDAVAQKVTNGGTKMPSFKKQLSPTQVKAVAAYVQSLGSRS